MDGCGQDTTLEPRVDRSSAEASYSLRSHEVPQSPFLGSGNRSEVTLMNPPLGEGKELLIAWPTPHNCVAVMARYALNFPKPQHGERKAWISYWVSVTIGSLRACWCRRDGYS